LSGNPKIIIETDRGSLQWISQSEIIEVVPPEDGFPASLRLTGDREVFLSEEESLMHIIEFWSENK
jgi:hypothetical protein